MRRLRYLVIFLLMGAGTVAEAGIGVDGIPATSVWYVHVDFAEMRSTEAGKPLYGWLQDEVLSDLREESGVDLDKEADTITAFSSVEDGTAIVIDGRISQETQDKALAMGAASGNLDRLGSGNRAYYRVKGDGRATEVAAEGEHGNYNVEFDSFDDGAYFSFAVKGKLIVTSTEKQMLAMLDNKGKVPAEKNPKGALIVLSAERSLMQAGVKADEVGEDVDWDSNILRNTEQAALLISDEAGKIAFEAQLVTTQKEMAESLASIVRGLISLQVFNDGIDPEIASFLQATSVTVSDRTLTIKVALDPAVVIATLE
jgi:hypothetical protein